MLGMPVYLATGKRAKECPYCQSEAVRRSRRKNLFEDTVCRVVFLSPYRCEKCDGRYFLLGQRRPPLETGQTSPSSSPQAL